MPSVRHGFQGKQPSEAQQQQQQQQPPPPWPTEPGAAVTHLNIPAPPSMHDIEEAFTESAAPAAIAVSDSEAVAASSFNTHANSTNVYAQEDVGQAVVRADAEHLGEQTVGVATAVATEEIASNEWRGEASSSAQATSWESSHAAMHIPENNAPQAAVAAVAAAHHMLPSPHVPFRGYVDEKGVLHEQSANCIDNGNNHDNNNGGTNDPGSLQQKSTGSQQKNTKCPPQKLSTRRMSSLSSTNGEEDKLPVPVVKSAESIFQDSLTFERSNPEKRFSSSLENYYASSGSSRHLYPSLEDVGDSDFAPSGSGRFVSREESSSVRTTVSGVIRSAASTESGAEAASSMGAASSIVPEPPGTEHVAYASFQCADGNVLNENPSVDASALASPAYAVASLEGAYLDSAEARVLETTQTPEEELLRKLEAEDAELLALKRSAYMGGSAVSSALLSTDHQQATVVEITEHDVHPSDISNNSVRAELIGEDYNNTAGVPMAAGSAAEPNYHSTYETTTAHSAAESAVFAVEDSGYAVVDQEATVIDQEATNNGWYLSQTEEAMVLNHEDSSSIPYSERKLPAVNSRPLEDHQDVAAAVATVTESAGQADTAVGFLETVYSQRRGHQTVAFAAEEAEVVGITEEFHPAEVTGREAQAELVGQLAEECRGVAVASPQPTTTTSTTHTGATPSLLGEANGVQAAMVVGYEEGHEQSDGIARARSLGVAVTDPITTVVRANSAPSAVGTRISLADTPATSVVHEVVAELETVVEEDWMRTPSFRGESSDSVLVLQPPRDGEEQPQAVAVASLDAFSNSQVPAVDDTECSAATQPTVPAVALDAVATSPAAELDPTDCSLVNRATRQPEALTRTAAVSNGVTEPELPPPRSFHSSGGASGGVSDGASVGSSASSSRVGFQKISSSFARGMEMLFGDTKIASPNGRRSEAVEDTSSSVAKSVVPRELLPWSVIHSEATNMWVATVNTNQKALDSKNVVEASKSLRAFSVVTDKQATCLAKAWSPPRMHAFSKNPACAICKSKFAVFRRACHCRNCGICVCTTCVVNWPAKMVPETYNIKKESFVNICKACDWLCTSFRVSLLEGNRDKAIALHATGNINLVTPFANVKGELFYPVHCAALGGDLELLKWLVDENCCPIKSVRVSGRCRDASNSFTEISTSKGRSLLGIALENSNVGIVRYLVVEKGIQLAGEKDITMDTLCRNLDLVLRFLPEDAVGYPGVNMNPPIATAHDTFDREGYAEPKQATTQPSLRALDDSASEGSVSDACIICFDATIDCVATPCGHQICCIKCSTNITKCPVCAIDCTFMRVFRP